MGIEASYRRINAAEWDKLQQLLKSYPTLDGEDRYEGYANIADSDELRSSDRYPTIDKDWDTEQLEPLFWIYPQLVGFTSWMTPPALMKYSSV